MTVPIPFQASIPPVPPGDPRPQWSVMIPTYHCAGFLRETLASVLAQDPGPDQMQIEVVDDHSTQDDPAAVVAELGQGRVTFFRQPQNGGHTHNFDTCLRRARGHLVHLLHGDDTVAEGFYRAMQRPFTQHPEIGAAFCRQIIVDEAGYQLAVTPLEQPQSGILPDWLATIAVGQRLQTPAMVVRRSVYEHLGGFDRRIRYYGEDWEMWVRHATYYPVWYEVAPLARYRMHPASLSGRTVRSGENVQDLRRAVEIMRGYLPTERAAQLAGRAHTNHARAALRRAHRILDAGDHHTPLVQMREALRCSHTPDVLARALFLLTRWSLRTMRTQLTLQRERGTHAIHHS